MEYRYLMNNSMNMFLQCPSCDVVFNNQLMLQEHIKNHMKAACGDSASAPGRSHLKEEESRCTVCGKVFAKRDHLKRHELTHSDLRPHKCHICQSTFKRKDKLTAHVSSAHGVSSPIARTPVSHFSGRSKMPSGAAGSSAGRVKDESQSQQASPPDRDFVCEFCFIGFTRKYHLDRHVSASHGGVKAHQCGDCGRRFTRKDHMER